MSKYQKRNTDLGSLSRKQNNNDDIKRFLTSGKAPVDKGNFSSLSVNKESSPRSNVKNSGAKPFQDRDDRYDNSLKKMRDNIDHNDHHYDPKIRQRLAYAAEDQGVNKNMYPDKLEILRNENIQLKSKQRDLEGQVKIIATKLKRQINQLKKDRLVGDKSKLTAQFDKDIDKLIEDNIKLQDEENDLVKKIKKLQAIRKQEIGKSKNLYSTLDEDRRRAAERATATQTTEITTLRSHIDKSYKMIAMLKNQIEGGRREADSIINVDDLNQKRRETELSLMQVKGRLQDLTQSYQNKQQAFDQNTSFERGLFQKLKDLQTEGRDLEERRSALEIDAQGTTEELQIRIRDTRQERDNLQRQFDAIMRQPFFAKQAAENAQTNMDRLEQMQIKLDDTEQDIINCKKTILQTDKDIQKHEEMYQSSRRERDQFSSEINKMKAHLDPNSLTMQDIVNKLQTEDPTKFRQVMADLKWEGDDPLWYRKEFMEQLNIGKKKDVDENDKSSLLKLKETMKNERRSLAQELDKAQKLLKLQCDMDRNTAAEQQNEINMLHSQIKQNNNRIDELNKLIMHRNKSLLTIQKTVGSNALTEAGLARLNQEVERVKKQEGRPADDALSEFSIITEESEIGALENLLDLRISGGNLDRRNLTQLLGNKDLNPSQISTFLAVDFYNHDSKNTDLAETFEPVYNTLFSFKNLVDDFYLKNLEKGHITVDVYLTRNQSTILIGKAELPLSKIIEKDSSMQAQEIIFQGQKNPDGSTSAYSPNQVSVGKLFYRMRMRKSIDSALLHYNNAKAIGNVRDPRSNNYFGRTGDAGVNDIQSKVVEINVISASGLRIANGDINQQNMQPFFSYMFYQSEYRSAIARGTNPVYESCRRFEVEANGEFLEYMKKHVLKIDFIDDSVDISQVSMRDYIGSARIPLRDLLRQKHISGTYPIIDDLKHETGQVQIKMVIHDVEPGNNFLMNSNNFKSQESYSLHIQMTQNTINAIAEKFADAGFEDLDMLFDMLFTKNLSTDMRRTGGAQMDNKTSRDQFIDYVLHDVKVKVSEKDLEIVLKTHERLQGRNWISREDLKAIFEQPFVLARERLLQKISNTPNVRQFQQTFNKTNNFDQTLNDRSPINNPFRDDHNVTIANQQSNSSPYQVNNMDTSTRPQRAEDGLDKVLQEKLYDAVAQFQRAAGDGIDQVLWETFRRVMSRYTRDENEIKQFWETHKLGNAFYFMNLVNIYGKEKIIPTSTTHNDPDILLIKGKIQDYLFRKDYNLDTLFQILDSNNDDSITVEEFTNKMIQQEILDQQECLKLFMSIDIDKSNTLSVEEIKSELRVINAAFIFVKIKENIQENSKGKQAAKKLKQAFDSIDTDGSKELDIYEFVDLVELNYQEVSKMELDLLFKMIDIDGSGQISLEELKTAFDRTKLELHQPKLIRTIDIMLPLIWKIKSKMHSTTSKVFDKFSRDGKMYIKEFAKMIQSLLGYELNNDETKTMQKFISDCNGGNLYLTEINFDQQINSKAKWKYKSLGQGDKQLAMKTGQKMKSILRIKRKAIMSELEKYQSYAEKQAGEINIRSLKHMLKIVCSLDASEMDNLIQYLDESQQSGFIQSIKIQQLVQ